jgi:hypothetical protein
MGIPTAFVRNFLSAVRPWVQHNKLMAASTDIGLILTSYLGSVFCLHDSYHELSRGCKDLCKFNRVLLAVDQHYFATSAPGPEFMIVRHAVLDRLKKTRCTILSGLVKAVFAVAFVIMAVAMMDVSGQREQHRERVIFNGLAAMFAVFPFFVISKWKTYVKNNRWTLQWQHFAMHLNSVNQQSEEPHVDIFSKGFDSGFGDTHSMYDIFLALKKTHVAAWDAPGASANPALLAIEEVKAVRTVIEDIDDEFKARKRGKRSDVMSSTLSRAQGEAISAARACERRKCQDLVSFVCNFIAHYGYVVRILVYFFPESATSHCCMTNCCMRLIKLGCSDEFAIFWFKFIADIGFTLDCAMDLKLIDLTDCCAEGDESESEKIKQD